VYGPEAVFAPAAGDLQSRLAKPLEQLFDELLVSPFSEFLIRDGREIRSYRKQFPNSVTCRLSFPKLAISCCERKACPPEPGHVDFESEAQSSAVIVLAIGLEERWKPVPSRMMGIAIPGTLY
jgi:hypothetical protein